MFKFTRKTDRVSEDKSSGTFRFKIEITHHNTRVRRRILVTDVPLHTNAFDQHVSLERSESIVVDEKEVQALLTTI